MAGQTDRRRGSGLASLVATAPLMPLASAATAGIVADRFLVPDWGTLRWAMLALGAALVAGLARRGGALGLSALLLAWAALGGGWHHHRWSDLPGDDLAGRLSEADPPRLAWLRGMLADVPTLSPRPASSAAFVRPNDPGTTRALLDASAISDGRRWHPVSGRVQLVISGDRTDLRAGDTVQAAGSLSAVPGPLNPGEFDYREYLRAQGIRLRLSVGDPISVWPEPKASRPGGFVGSSRHTVATAASRWLGAARAWSHARLVSGLDPAVAPLAAALLLGRREGVDPEVNDAFARTGTTHLLAISGLHLQVLAGALWLAFLAIGLERRRAFLAVALATVAYALLVGLAPSVVRSAAMTLTVCLGAMRDRRPRPANMLALAALVTMLLNPSHVFDVGCQLSFLAVGAIAWGVAPALAWLRFGYYSLTFAIQGPASPLDELERRFEPWWRTLTRRRRAIFVQGLTVSAVVWLVSAPLVALRFHIVSPIGIAMNIPLIPITSFALLAAGLTLGLSAIWPPLGVPSAWLCARSLALTERLVRWGAAQTWGYAFVPGPPTWWTVAAYAALAFLAVAAFAHWPAPIRRAGWGILAGWGVLGTVLAWAWITPAPGALEADILAVGHGLSVVVQTAEGRVMVYDCGRMGDPGVGRRLIAPALWARGVRRIDTLVLSHNDSDHVNGLPDLLDRFAIGSVRLSRGFARPEDPGASALLDRLRARGVAVHEMARGDRWDLGVGTTCTALHPPRDWQTVVADNDRSLVLDLSSAGRHLLLTGDAEAFALVTLLSQPGTADADVPPFDALLAPHHGGRTANPPWFYDWARPSLVAVSQRRPNAGAQDTLAFLAGRQVPVLRTWQRGAIRLRWGSSGLSARGSLDEPTRNLTVLAMFPPRSATWVRVVLTLGGLAIGLVLCGVVAVVEWGAWILVRPRRRLRKRDDPEQADTPLWQPIEATAFDGAPLHGVWRSEGSDPSQPARRVAFVLHGFLEDGQAMRGRGNALAGHGWSVALPDARGHGQSGGDHASFGAREADDFRAWLDALTRSGQIAPDARLAVWGRSMGAAVALRAAESDPRPAALVLEAPYPDLESAVEGWLERLRVPGRLAVLIVRRAAAIAGVSLSRPRPIDLAPSIHLPTLILHGSDDSIVPLPDARRLANAFPHPAPILEVPGARHANILDVGGPEVLDRVAAFLDDAVPPGEAPGATTASPRYNEPLES